MTHYRSMNGNAGATAVAAAGAASASIAAGGTTAAALTAIGVGAQAVPVIGQVLGVLALAGGLLLTTRAKVKNIKNNIASVELQNAELRRTSAELDTQINTVGQQVSSVNAQLQSRGLSGLGEINGLSTWLKKTFTPVRYQKSVLKTKEQDNAELTKQVETKISNLQQLIDTLDSLSKKLIEANKVVVANVQKNQQSYLLAGGALLIAGIWYFNTRKSTSTKNK